MAVSPDDPNVFLLQHPIEYGDGLLDRIEIKQIKRKHLKGFPLNLGEAEVDCLIDLGAKAAGIPPLALHEMDAADAMEFAMFVASTFLGSDSERPGGAV